MQMTEIQIFATIFFSALLFGALLDVKIPLLPTAKLAASACQVGCVLYIIMESTSVVVQLCKFLHRRGLDPVLELAPLLPFVLHIAASLCKLSKTFDRNNNVGSSILSASIGFGIFSFTDQFLLIWETIYEEDLATPLFITCATIGIGLSLFYGAHVSFTALTQTPVGVGLPLSVCIGTVVLLLLLRAQGVAEACRRDLNEMDADSREFFIRLVSWLTLALMIGFLGALYTVERIIHSPSTFVGWVGSSALVNKRSTRRSPY